MLVSIAFVRDSTDYRDIVFIQASGRYLIIVPNRNDDIQLQGSHDQYADTKRRKALLSKLLVRSLTPLTRTT